MNKRGQILEINMQMVNSKQDDQIGFFLNNIEKIMNIQEESSPVTKIEHHSEEAIKVKRGKTFDVRHKRHMSLQKANTFKSRDNYKHSNTLDKGKGSLFMGLQQMRTPTGP